MLFNQYKEYKKLFEILKEKSDSISKSGIVQNGQTDQKGGKSKLRSMSSANKSKLSAQSGASRVSQSKVDNLEIKKLDYTATKLKR